MYKLTPIICPNCKKDAELKVENFTYMTLSSDVKCPYCQYILIYANIAECSSQTWGTESENE